MGNSAMALIKKMISRLEPRLTCRFRVRNWGGFLLDGQLQPIESFDAGIHQDARNLDSEGRRAGLYVSNFVFT
jgi:hypothetical protein